MKEMQIYLRLMELICKTLGRSKLSLSECGTLAMAAQWVADYPAEGETQLRYLERAEAEGKSSNACYQILDMAYHNYETRAKSRDELLEKTYRIKCRLAPEHRLTGFILTGNIQHYPPFFRVYDAVMHTDRTGE